ncbi:Asp23/Gls24 family envelope stress response protein, partial [Dysosmobacter welbionis]
EVRRKPAGGEDEVAKVHDGDNHGADVAEAGDHVRQLPELHLQGRVRLVVLHLLGHLAHHGGKAHLAHIQHALAVKQHGAPEQGVGVHEGVAGDVLRQGEGLVRRGLGAFLRLAVEGG